MFQNFPFDVPISSEGFATFCKSFFFGQGHTYVENRSLFYELLAIFQHGKSTILYFFKIEHIFYNKYCFLWLWLNESSIKGVCLFYQMIEWGFFFRIGSFPCSICFVHPIFRFWFLVTFGDEVTKLNCNLCFAREDGQDEKKNGKKSMQLKWPKYQKPKDKNMGWMKP